MRGSLRLTVRGWALLVAGAALFVTMEVLQRREFAFVGVLLFALVAVGVASVALLRPSLTVERVFTPELAPAGSRVTVRLVVTNRASRSGPDAVWFDGVPAPLPVSEPAPLNRIPGVASSATGSPTTVVLTSIVSATHRGRHAIGPFTMIATDPFGLVMRTLRFGGTDRLIVTPSTVVLPRGSVRLAAGSGIARQSRQLGGAGEQDVISRKYQTGDSMRRVNWAATARFGELMVRQDDQQNDQHAVVILDSSASSYPAMDATATCPEYEWAVSMTTSLALHLLEEGFHVRLVDSAAVHHGSPHHGVALSGSVQGPAARAEGVTFEPGAGMEQVLVGAADSALSEHPETDYRRAVGTPESVGGELSGLFAVVGELSPESARSLASAARTASNAVAIVVTPASGGVPPWAVQLRHTLEGGGFVVQLVSSDTPPDVAWASVGGERLVL